MGPQVVLRFPKTMSEEKIKKILDHFQQIDPSKSIQVDRYDETLQFNQASEAHEDNAALKFKRAYEAQKAHIDSAALRFRHALGFKSASESYKELTDDYDSRFGSNASVVAGAGDGLSSGVGLPHGYDFCYIVGRYGYASYKGNYYEYKSRSWVPLGAPLSEFEARHRLSKALPQRSLIKYYGLAA